MLEHLPEYIREGLIQARRRDQRQGKRLSVHVGDAVFPLLSLWEDGFAVDAGRTPRLRGSVDLYDGPRHLSHCLIIAASLEGERMSYEFKARTEIFTAPPRDYADERGPEPVHYLHRN